MANILAGWSSGAEHVYVVLRTQTKAKNPDQIIVDKELKRIIPTAAAFGGAIIGVLSVGADLLG